MNQNPNNTPLFLPLKYRLHSRDSYILGEPITIQFTLKNLTNSDLWFLTWYTPFEGLKGKIFQVTCDRREIRYEGRMIKRGDPNSNDYLHVGPRRSLSTEVDLSLAYNIPVTNKCLVTFRGRIYDVVYDQKSIPRKRDEHQRIDISGNVVVFRIVDL